MRNTRRVRDEPIIQSLLDVDFYKFTMGQLIFLEHPGVRVRFSFHNRTSQVRLASRIDAGELREQLDHVRSLSFSHSDLHYLRGTNEYGERMFREPYLEFLRTLRLSEFAIEIVDGDLALHFDGPWAQTTHWETLALSIVSELFSRSLEDELTPFERETYGAQGVARLAEKIRKIRAHGQIVFSEFGTRRRFSRPWQDHVIEVLANEVPAEQFRGTSNTFLANKYGLLPMGSNGHELPMVYSGIFHDEDDATGRLVSQERVLADWEALYGLGLSLALPDTFGSDYFFDRIFTQRQYEEWKGSRQDSGDPIEYGEKRIANYRAHGVDPSGKLILFSDALDVDRIIEIHDHFDGRIVSTFGWGTDLTNDLGFERLSLVLKPTEANGHKLAKLSDNLDKATGDAVAVDRMKRLTGYDVQYAKSVPF